MMASTRYRQEMKRRQTVIEGVHAHLDHLGWEKCKLRGLWKVDCEGYIAALAHNLLKALTKVRWKRRAAKALATTGTKEQTGRDTAAKPGQSLPLSSPYIFPGSLSLN